MLMEQLADSGDGFYAYVDTLKGAERVFVHDLTSTLQVIARDAKIQVDFNPAIVSRYRLIGYENRDVADEDFRNDEVDAGEIGVGHSVTALYEVKFHPNPARRLPGAGGSFVPGAIGQGRARKRPGIGELFRTDLGLAQVRLAQVGLKQDRLR